MFDIPTISLFFNRKGKDLQFVKKAYTWIYIHLYMLPQRNNKEGARLLPVKPLRMAVRCSLEQRDHTE